MKERIKKANPVVRILGGVYTNTNQVFHEERERKQKPKFKETRTQHTQNIHVAKIRRMR